MKPPLMIELFSGLHGWGEPAAAMGYRVVGFDIVDMCAATGQPRPAGCQLVLQDVLTLHGSQFRDAAVICASPPCTEYSYMAMPWSRSKAIARALRGQGEFPKGYSGSRDLATLNALFQACFRIQREASEAAGRYIPLVVENVKGAQPWVGSAMANFGSYYLWGDVRLIGNRIVRAGALEFGMPTVAAERAIKWGGCSGKIFSERPTGNVAMHREGTNVKQANGVKGPGGDWFANGRQGQDACSERYRDGVKQGGSGAEWWREPLQERRKQATAVKNGGDWFGAGKNCSAQRRQSSRSDSRKAASALIARIPEPLARHIARVFWPSE